MSEESRTLVGMTALVRSMVCSRLLAREFRPLSAEVVSRSVEGV